MRATTRRGATVAVLLVSVLRLTFALSSLPPLTSSHGGIAHDCEGSCDATPTLTMDPAQTMKAVLTRGPGKSDVLYIGDTEKPICPVDGVLVKVMAAGLNRADILQREGKYPPPAGTSTVIGLEVSGVVVEVGASAGALAVGDRVAALLSGGGYAQYVAIPAAMVIKVPDAMSFVDAAAVPEAFLTAMQALIWIAELKSGESVLIHAAGSGVGTAATQLARVVGASHIICTAGGDDKLALSSTLGASTVINYKTTPKWSEAVLAATGGAGVNVIIDFIGGDYWNNNLAAAALDGRMVMLAFLSEPNVEGGQLGPILRKRLRIQGSTLRNRSAEYKAKLTQDLSEKFMPLFATGELRAIVDTTFHARDVAAAHEHMEANKNLGKILLTGFDEL